MSTGPLSKAVRGQEMDVRKLSTSTLLTSDRKMICMHVILSDPLLPESIVPNEYLHFGSSDEAYDFYYYYAIKSGFSVYKTRTHFTVRKFSCNRHGKCVFYKHGEGMVREKTPRRCACKAFVKIKWNKKRNFWFFERIRLEHNHPLESLLLIA